MNGTPSTRRERLRLLLSERWRLLSLLVPHRALLALLCTIHLCAAAVPAASALLTGWLVRAIPPFGESVEVLAAVWQPLAVLAAVLLVHQLTVTARDGVEQLVAGLVDGDVRQHARQLAARPVGTEHLEEPDLAADFERASDIGEGFLRSPGSAAVGQLTLMFRMLAAALSAVVVARASLLLAAGVLVASVTMRALIRRQWLHLAHVRDGLQPFASKVKYWTRLGTSAAAGKELRLFGLGEWVTSQRTEAAVNWGEPVWRTRGRIVARQHWTYLLTFSSAAAVLLLPALAARRGELTTSELLTCVIASWSVFAISSMGSEAFAIDYGLGAVRAFDRLRHRFGEEQSDAALATDTGGAPHVRVHKLSFGYPGMDRPVLNNLSLTIRPGEVLALVGRNGVGKTTLIKLLASLHQPQHGRIEVDGVALTAAHAPAWRSRMAIVFQDFTKYPMTLADNIALGAAEHRDDIAGIRAAVMRAGADGFVDSLPRGLDTVLSGELSGGVDLSGGQWQKIALARAVFALDHGRDFLVLDEPTAHLDVTAEAAFNRRITDLAGGASVLLISHRLSTVRHADRILVLEDGSVGEEGSHDELMAAEGAYAALFRLQASAFTNTQDAQEIRR
ncbi:ABC transporter ATP-binding protein [Streptomyces olivaceus]|uniref:ABC transporter ATP-binding protein n=1 Tax=Streptomyces olivaceus TaxID=47716 RepID=UPI00368EB26A